MTIRLHLFTQVKISDLELYSKIVPLYQEQGIDRFHTVAHISNIDHAASFVLRCKELGIEPPYKMVKQYNCSVRSRLLKERQLQFSLKDWWMPNDADELRLPNMYSLHEISEECVARSWNCYIGPWVDRFTESGQIPDKLEEDIVQQFPIRCLYYKKSGLSLTDNKVVVCSPQTFASAGWHVVDPYKGDNVPEWNRSTASQAWATVEHFKWCNARSYSKGKATISVYYRERNFSKDIPHPVPYQFYDVLDLHDNV